MKLPFAVLFVAVGLPGFAVARVGNSEDDQAHRVLPKQPGGGNLSGCEFPGNGFPSGKADFKLNLLGKMKDNNFKANGNNNIVISLSEQCRGKNGDNCSVSAITDIKLYNSDVDASCPSDYYILDPNGADGEAGLCLPDPFPDSEPCIDGTTGDSCDTPAEYAVYGRVRGKGNLGIGLCVEDEGTTYCPMTLLSLPKRRATDVSQQLLTVCVDADDDGNVDDGAGLFDCLGDVCGDEDYFWTLDNRGVRNAELRFYSIASLMEACDTAACMSCVAGVTRANAC